MACLIVDGKEFDLKDGSAIRDVCESAGVPFNCRSGLCGTCQIEILQGTDNLSPLNDEEEDMGMDIDHRLACQCLIVKGTVSITY